MVMMACCIEWRMCRKLVVDFLVLLPRLPRWFCMNDDDGILACLHGGGRWWWWQVPRPAQGERGSNYYFMQHRNVVFANDSRMESKRCTEEYNVEGNVPQHDHYPTSWMMYRRTHGQESRDLFCILKSGLYAYRYWTEIVFSWISLTNLRDELTTYGLTSTLDNYKISEWLILFHAWESQLSILFGWGQLMMMDAFDSIGVNQYFIVWCLLLEETIERNVVRLLSILDRGKLAPPGLFRWCPSGHWSAETISQALTIVCTREDGRGFQNKLTRLGAYR